MIPSAEEFLSQTSMLNKRLFPKKTQDFEQAVDRMLEFAKMHVEAALKAAAEQAEIENDWDNQKGNISKDSIVNAYPLETIK